MAHLSERMRRQLIRDLDRLQRLILMVAAGDRSLVNERDRLERSLEERFALRRNHRRRDAHRYLRGIRRHQTGILETHRTVTRKKETIT